MDPATLAKAIAAAITAITSITNPTPPTAPTTAATAAAVANIPDGWIDTPNGPRCVNGAPCSIEAGNDSTRYTFDWNNEPRLGIDGKPSTPITPDQIAAILAELEAQQ